MQIICETGGARLKIDADSTFDKPNVTVWHHKKLVELFFVLLFPD
jgi:hypothetical protein